MAISGPCIDKGAFDKNEPKLVYNLPENTYRFSRKQREIKVKIGRKIFSHIQYIQSESY